MKQTAASLNFKSSQRLPVILQSEATECGLVCIAMIAHYHGHKTELNSLRKNYPISLKGATLTGLINLAEKINFSSRSIRIGMSQLSQLSSPCILHWNMNHFVVLKKVIKNQIIIHDPAIGCRTISLDEASKNFTGVVLELTPSRQFKKRKKEKETQLSDFWNHITGLKTSFLQIITLSFILQFFAIIAPFYLQLVIDEVVVSEDYHFLQVLAIGFGLLLLIQLSISALRSISILWLSNQLSNQMATNLLQHLLSLPMDYFEKRHIGDIVSRFGSLDHIKKLLTTGLVEAIVDGLMALGLIIMMYIYNITLGLIVTLAVVIYILFRIIMYKPLRNSTEENIAAKAKQNTNFMETVRGMQTIKLFGHELQRQNLWNNHYVNELNTGIKIGKLEIKYTFFNGLIFGLENIFIIYVAANQVMNHFISVGMLFAFMSYKRQFIEKITLLIDKFIEFKMMSLHLQRLGDIVLADKETHLHSNHMPKPITGAITCNDIAFSYSDDMGKILTDVNVSIEAGSCVAIVGGSGSGKTTLLKILLGLLKPSNGQVLIDGQDIHKMGLRNFRNNIGSVMQDDTLLSGNMIENITFFDPEIDQDYMYKCAKMAAIHDDIMNMPMGYHSLIGDMGSGLSGGQQQRILLARALYKKPKILFLDEATSHLDLFLESSVNEAIKQLNITKVIVAHRPQTIATADKVIILYNGKTGSSDTKQYLKCLNPAIVTV